MARKLRPYQEEIVASTRMAFTQHSAVLMALATGGGKTVIFTHIVEGAQQKGKSAVILVHREELVTQCSLSLAENGLLHRIIAPARVQRDVMRDHISIYGQSFIHPATDVVVASIQTLIRNFDRLPPPDLIVCDEAHHMVATTYGKVIAQYPNAKILGVTATPERPDGAGMNNVFNVLVTGIGVRDLIKQGHLCVPRVYSPPVGIDFSKLHSRFGDFQKEEIEKIMSSNTIVGDAVEHYNRLCPGVPAIVFCVSVWHAKQVADRFSAAGYRAVALDGKTDKVIRKGALAALGRGDLDIVTSCDLISEGVDVPLAGCAILLRPTKSVVIFLQQCGRVLRPYPVSAPVMQKPEMQKLIGPDGTHYAYILDHAGNTLRHGLPQADRNWTLTTDKKKRDKPSGDDAVRACPVCDFIHTTDHDACPNCGFSYVPEDDLASGGAGGDSSKALEELEGTLVEAVDARPDLDWTRGHSLTKTKLKKLVELAVTIEHFRQIAEARGYKRGWAFFAFNEKQEGRKAAQEPLRANA